MNPESFWSLLDEEENEIAPTEKIRIYLPSGKYIEVPMGDVCNYDDETAELTIGEKLMYLDVNSVVYLDMIDYKHPKEEKPE